MARVIFAGYLVRYPLGGYAWQLAGGVLRCKEMLLEFS